MSSRAIVQEVFDKAILELSSTGMIKQTNYAIIADRKIVPIECDNLKRSLDQETFNNMIATELARVNASGWVTVGVGAMVINDKVPKAEEKPKRKTRSKSDKAVKTKTKKKEATLEDIQKTLLSKDPVLSLITIHRTKTGKTEILYSKLLQDPKGTYYTDLEEKWIDKQEDLQLTEQN